MARVLESLGFFSFLYQILPEGSQENFGWSDDEDDDDDDADIGHSNNDDEDDDDDDADIGGVVCKWGSFAAAATSPIFQMSTPPAPASKLTMWGS